MRRNGNLWLGMASDPVNKCVSQDIFVLTFANFSMTIPIMISGEEVSRRGRFADVTLTLSGPAFSLALQRITGG